MEKYLKEKIARLRKEIEQLEKNGVPTHKSGTVTLSSYDSDLGVRVPSGETNGWVPMSPEERRAAQSRRDLELYSLRSELKQAQEELFKIEWDKPENVAKRQEEALISRNEEKEEQLKEERSKHEEKYDDLNMLVECLEFVGMRDLARRLSQLRYAFKNKKSDYITKEIDLQSREKQFRTKVQITKKEHRQIRKSVIRLTKDATKMAKRYKDLYGLYAHAWEIIDDMKEKGIINRHGQIDYDQLKKYFKQPTGEYYFRDKGSFNHYGLKESSNLGYEYLAFYRDYSSKYSEGVRKGRI